MNTKRPIDDEVPGNERDSGSSNNNNNNNNDVIAKKKPRRRRSAKLKELPQSLERLERLFANVNTFCAFCDARLTTAITWDRIRSAVPGVELEDLAAINVILPDFVHFSTTNDDDYNSRPILLVQFGKPVNKRIAREKHGQAVGNRGDDWKMQREAPKVKPEAIKKLIDTQNKQFKKGLSAFIDSCQSQEKDPEECLKASLRQHMPLHHDTVPEHNQKATEEREESDLQNEQQSRSMSNIIAAMRNEPFYRGQLDNPASQREIPPRSAKYGSLEPPLAQEIADALSQKGIDRLYIHQAEAIQGLRDNHHVIVATSTASGKSLIYQIPVLEALLRDRSSRAMYIFPTKALAQDQMRSLQELISCCPSLEGTMVSTFDGDTPSDQRAHIRETANVIFTNPDMLHHSILPNAARWRAFLMKLRYIVVDELHVYNGLFGTNVAFIMRRLRRLCRYYGNDSLQFVSCSATIQSPDQHMRLVFGVDDIKLVNQDGAPSGKKIVIVWNPPLLSSSSPETGRRGAVAEGADLFEYLLCRNIRTIAFCNVRKTCELLMRQLRENLEKKQKVDLLKRVMSYRGGYMPHERRKIERQLFSGELLGVVATNALELGVDIGSLDAVIMIGMPWSISALWQQSGRAGRRNADSLSMVVTDSNPMDQFFANHPDELFEKPLDNMHFEVENNALVLENHLQCAAEELAIDVEKDRIFFGPLIKAICDEHLAAIGNNLYRPHSRFRPYPSQFVNIRNITEETYAVIDVTANRNVVLEEIEASRAPFEIYEGAIFIHQGQSYLVEECNVDQRYAKVHLARVDWTTQQRDYTNVNAIQTVMRKPISSDSDSDGVKNFVGFGKVQIETVVFGYYKMDKRNRIMDSLDVYMDPIVRYSTGIWVDVPSKALARLEELQLDRMASIHGAAHAMISLLPRFTSSTTTDIRTECKSPYAKRPRPPRIALYETQPSGIVRQAYQFFDALIRTCVQQIQDCPCEEGCSSCVHLTSCSEHNVLCSKTGALIVLLSLLNRDISEVTEQARPVENLAR